MVRPPPWCPGAATAPGHPNLSPRLLGGHQPRPRDDRGDSPRRAQPTSSGQLRHILWDLIDQQGKRNLVIDLRDMTVGDGADLELFVEAWHCAWERGGHLKLSGLCGGTSEALARAGLTEALEVDPSRSHGPGHRPGSPKTQKGRNHHGPRQQAIG